MSDNLPDLTNTAKALLEFDNFQINFDHDNPNLMSEIEKKNAFADAVSAAFGQDTADRNHPEDCSRLMNSPKGETFIRKMVTLWKLQSAMKVDFLKNA